MVTMEISDLIAHHSEHSPGFRARMVDARLDPQGIRTVDDLNKLPVLRKERLVEHQSNTPPFGGFLSHEPGLLKRIFQSPGPIYDPEPDVPDYWRWEEALRAAGFQSGELVLNAFGYHLTPAGAMFEEGLLAVGCTVMPGGVGNKEQQVQMLHSLKVTGYVGLPSYLNALVDKAEELGLTLHLNKAFVAAEPLPSSLREALNEQGIVVRQGYGTAECGNLGYECEREDGWHTPEDVIIQVCDINSGQPVPAGASGEVVVTLGTPCYAIIRFGTGDLSSLDYDPCPCGLSAPRLMGWQGRVDDAVKVRGMFLHPHQVAGMTSRFDEITNYEVVITREAHRDELTLRIALAEGTDVDPLVERLKTTAREMLKFRLAVEVVPLDELEVEDPVFRDEREWD